MNVVLALSYLLALGFAQPVDDDDEWENYKRTYGKDYGGSDSELDRLRRILYFETKEHIQESNELYEQGLKSYKLAINHLADLHHKEVTGRLTGFKNQPDGLDAEIYTPLDASPLPDSVDWRTKNAVTSVKDQVLCGCCWAFSTVGSLEGQWALKKGQLNSLSAQQLVDCDSYDDGCKGGNIYSAFQYIIDNGIDSDATYPYTGNAVQGTCEFNNTDVVATITSYVRIMSGSEEDLQNAVATVGPISVAINANSDFHHYGTGIFDEPSCTSLFLNHCVLVVGYGELNGQEYWITKNSWGTDWGINGYGLMSRNKNNQCGIASEAGYPVV